MKKKIIALSIAALLCTGNVLGKKATITVYNNTGDKNAKIEVICDPAGYIPTGVSAAPSQRYLRTISEKEVGKYKDKKTLPFTFEIEGLSKLQRANPFSAESETSFIIRWKYMNDFGEIVCRSTKAYFPSEGVTWFVLYKNAYDAHGGIGFKKELVLPSEKCLKRDGWIVKQTEKLIELKKEKETLYQDRNEGKITDEEAYYKQHEELRKKIDKLKKQLDPPW
ncbi:hypothetical protein ACFLYA_00055 [Candidatus Dependentiae bacterium]